MFIIWKLAYELNVVEFYYLIAELYVTERIFVSAAVDFFNQVNLHYQLKHVCSIV